MNLLAEIPFDIPLKEVILQPGIASSAAKLCENLGKLLLICDENTKDFVKLPAEKIILPANHKPTLAAARELAKHAPDCFVAVGSGSLNDTVKYAAYLANKPYIVFATAPSMNGYISTSASLLESGYKKSYLARPPIAAYFDTEILSAAPKRLIASGIGDSICRSTCQADVTLSHQLLGTPNYAELFQLMKKNEAEIFSSVEALTKTLVIFGAAMLHAKSSAPASQGEHMLAHYMELMQPNAPHSYHGEQIAVTTLTMAGLQEKLLDGADFFQAEKLDTDEIINHFAEEFGAYCREQTNAKYNKLAGGKLRIDKRAIEQNLVKAETLRSAIQAAHAPIGIADIGWDEKIYHDALKFTKYTRDRFTFLDLI